MRLYNPLSQDIEPFTPAGDAVSVYACGITPYDTTHLGHAFTYVNVDVLIRYLISLGHEVRYVQNVTDIDDDILRRADEVGEDWKALGDRWTAYFIRDMKSLNVLPPDRFPRATDTIPQIIQLVERLLEVGVAYEVDGNVYFEVDAWSDYGRLSGLSKEEMLPIANERGNNPDDANKRDPLDFVLWQAQAPGEPAWDSPWGKGRPGWHIECSTMAADHLGQTIDVHGGGSDLLFPHHESEIAQAECAIGQRPFVRFWMHTAMVHHEGEKMSKSLGNLVMVRDLLQTWSPDAIRLYLSSHHYRQVWGHDDNRLARADKLARKLHAAVVSVGVDDRALDPAPAMEAFHQAMDDDLRTPGALEAMEQLADQTLERARTGGDVQAAQEALRHMGRILGLRLDADQPEARVVDGWDRHLEHFV